METSDQFEEKRTDAMRQVAALEELTEEEGSCVEYLSMNPEGQDGVDCYGEWTGWRPKRFLGMNRLQALERGLVGYRQWKQESVDRDPEETEPDMRGAVGEHAAGVVELCFESLLKVNCGNMPDALSDWHKAAGVFQARLDARRREAGIEGTVWTEADALERAWGLIENAYGGDWDEAHPDWKEAAQNFRDDYLRRIGNQQGEETDGTEPRG